MSNDWDLFRASIPSRLLLPIRRYECNINFPPFVPTEDELESIKQCVRNAAVDAIEHSEHPSMEFLELPESDDDNTIFIVYYGDATYDFRLTLTRDRLSIFKHKVTVEEFFLTLPIIEEIAQALLGKDGSYSLYQFKFFRPYNVGHVFNQSIDLGERLSDDTQSVTNIEIMSEFFCRADAASAVAWVQPDWIARNSFEAGLVKNIDGRIANLYIEAEAPYDPPQRALDFEFSLFRGASPRHKKLVDEDLFEFRRVFEGFYRDIVVNRIYKAVFKDSAVRGSIR